MLTYRRPFMSAPHAGWDRHVCLSLFGQAIDSKNACPPVGQQSKEPRIRRAGLRENQLPGGSADQPSLRIAVAPRTTLSVGIPLSQVGSALKPIVPHVA